MNYIDIGDLEIFKTPYKIKLKGMFATKDRNSIYILETHQKLYGIELIRDKREVELHEDLYNILNLDKLLDKATKIIKCEQSFEILENNKNQLIFKSTILELKFNKNESLYNLVISDRLAEYLLKNMKNLVVSAEEFKNSLYNKDIIKKYEEKER